MTQKQEVTALGGGLDLITPPIAVAPGSCIACKNFEATDRGYRLTEGYEVFDGRAKPSDATYSVLDFDEGQAAISSGDTVTGATSSATGIAVVDATVETGSYVGSDATGYVVLREISGTFQDDELLQVAAATKSRANGTPVVEAADSDTLHDTYIAAIQTARRSAITAPTGSGAIRGIHVFDGDVYCFRDNAGGTALLMYKATTAGWVEQTFGNTIYFDAGTTAFAEGETVTGGTSAATAVIRRVVVKSGAWDGTAAGYLVVDTVSGTFQNNETITSASGSATEDGTCDAITLAAGGKVRCLNHNFYGTSNYYRMYGSISNGFAFEWDGTTLTPIDTSVSTALDKPKFIGVHANHLMLGYDGGSVMISGVGLPLSYLANDGAAEIGIGQDITGILSASFTASVIFAENRIGYLQGTSSADFVFEIITDESGSKQDTATMLDEPIFMDQQGVRRLSTADAFGDWKRSTLSRRVQPLIDAKTKAGTYPVGAHKVRAKDQYRLYYDDGDVLSIYLGKKNPECMVQILGFTPECTAVGEDSNGEEIIFVGDDSGNVYQMDVGTSHNGTAYEFYIRMPWRHQRMPSHNKRYCTGELQVDSPDNDLQLGIGVLYGYGDPDEEATDETTFTVVGGGGIWDVSNWDEFIWDAPTQGVIYLPLNAVALNMSYVVVGDCSTYQPFTLSSDNVNYTQRRLVHG